ncbi:aryl-alcohol dehydrogenase-like predicted oxidoreductase [Kribbella antiqua]|uniref:Aryl-alcohol dehydrogenase-like predicted oxidoreductase n=1 Tax=Kribbella antiqua TaxID=2512217 RepID=A0A4R2IX80_9ACTN|nr:aldo/keto reductase [Kribbella antiqua]TCO50401.1 aryl-alcohol dehydrogenase-like predicted oxidoreductase [Kribbella antiqua]
MDYRALGRSGQLVSVVGVGCLDFGGRMDVAASRAVVDTAIELGVTLFDTADIYGPDGGSERVLGEVLAGRRDQVVIATKFGHPGVDLGFGPAAGAKGGRAYIRRAVEASLRRLRTDYIDLYQIHMPDPATPILETLAALNELVAEGKIRYLGHSNFAGWRLAEANHVARENGLTPFVSAQNNWSLLARETEAEVVPAAEHYGVGVLPYYPLAEGMLTGKVRRGTPLPDGTRIADRSHLVTEERLDRVDRLTKWCEANGRTLLEVAIGWLAAQPTVSSVIAGVKTPGQLRANVQAARWRPEAAELQAIDDLTSTHR